MGVRAYSVGIVHRFTHAFFFKALLLLGSGLGHHRRASRAGHTAHGRAQGSHPADLLGSMVIGTPLALTGFPLTAGYFLQDRHHRGAACVGANLMATAGFPHGDGKAALTSPHFQAADLQDFPWRSARSSPLRGGAREPAGHAGTARRARRRLAARRPGGQGPVRRTRCRGILPPIAFQFAEGNHATEATMGSTCSPPGPASCRP